jgi:hypothetical protein
MICPECGYEDATEDGYGDLRMSKEGPMFKLPIELKRDVGYCDWLEERADLYGCPKCKKLFLGD